MEIAMQEQTQMSGLIAVNENMPPIASPSDVEVDLDILRSVPKQFCIGNEKTANWLIKKVVAARQYAEQVKLWAALELRRAEREEHCLMFLFGRQAEAWAREELTKLNGKRKSIKLPAGTLSFRTGRARLVIDDEAKVLAWLNENLPEAIETTQKIKKSILNEHFEKTGQLPESGTHVQASRESFSIH